MARDNDRSQLFTRRALLLGAVQTGVFTLLAGRVYYLQMMQGEKYRTLADENRISLRLIAPPRGQILDKNGVALAINQQNYRLILRPEQVEKLEPLLDNLSLYLSLSETDKKRVARDMRSKKSESVLIRDNLSWDQVSLLSLHNLELGGTDIDVGEVRTYPFEMITPHVLGYVGAVSEKDVDNEKEEPLLSVPGFKIGKNGIEKFYDRYLRGSAGSVQLEVNARGRIVRELTRSEPKTGANLQTTIDIGLQQYVAQALSIYPSAAAVVMDVETGAIKALVSQPGFDPNLFTYGISQDDWDRLNNDPYTPLLNKVITGVYAPGSTFKPIVALAALDAGVMKPEETVFCPGFYTLGEHEFHCWKKGGHGTVNLISAMAGSCDTYFYDLGKRVGIDRIHSMAKRLGLGQRLGLDLPNEKSGLVPSRSWKLTTQGGLWRQGETLITAIGQGYLTVTPLQLAIMAARIANGGFAVSPRLVLSPDLEPPQSLGLKSDHVKVVQQAMAAVTSSMGTAYCAHVDDENMAMAGKTGTAQVRRITAAERKTGVLKNEVLEWEERDHALFIGFAPASKPRYAVSIVVEHGGSGAHIAAPIARDIIVEAQKRMS